MSTVIVVLGNAQLEPSILSLEGDFVGIDRGAYLLASNNISMRYAIGDFDSVTAVEFENIQIHAFEIIELNKEKDESDFEASLPFLEEYDDILVYGHWGDRFDHSIVNLRILSRDSRMTFFDLNNKVRVVHEGDYQIEKNDYRYLSIFTDENATVSLRGVKYPLENQLLSKDDLYTLSNEILDVSATLNVHLGKIIIIQSKD